MATITTFIKEDTSKVATATVAALVDLVDISSIIMSNMRRLASTEVAVQRSNIKVTTTTLNSSTLEADHRLPMLLKGSSAEPLTETKILNSTELCLNQHNLANQK